MSKLFQNNRFILFLCILGVLAASVPAGLSAVNIIHLRADLERIEKVSRTSNTARDVLEIVGHSVHQFMAASLELTAQEREKIVNEANARFYELESAVEDLRANAQGFISREQDAAVVEAISSISHSWQDLREEGGEPIPEAEKTFHFLKLFDDLQTTRKILSSVELTADAEAQTVTSLSFNRIERAFLLFMLVLSASAFIGALAIAGSYHFARTMRRANEHFNAALGNMTQGLCMFDRHKRLIVCNKRYLDLYDIPVSYSKPGTSFREILKQRVESGVYVGDQPKEYIEERLAAVEEAERSSKVQELKDGRFIVITHKPLSDGGWLATHEDITDQKRSAEALRESEQQFRNLIEGSLQGVFIARDWKLRFANQALADIFGYETPDELLALENVEPLLAPAERKRIYGYKVARERGEAAPEIYESQGLKKDGTIIDVEFRVRIVDWLGQPAMQCVVLDITDRKSAERELIRHRDHLQEQINVATRELRDKADELKQALEKEKELNELKSQFVSMASHEFRTPLSIIDTSAQRLKRQAANDRLSTEVATQKADKIRNAVRRITRLMESTLSAARMDEGKIKVEIGPCDIKSLVEEVCASQQEITAHQKINCSISPGLPEHIGADEGAIEQVLTNLLSNAVKYSTDNADIDVAAYTEDGCVVVSVRDHGIGIDDEDLQHIGERFFRAKTSTGIAGTGIGLNLVNKLLELHGGRLGVESKRGEGSTFKVFLPIADAALPGLMPEAVA